MNSKGSRGPRRGGRKQGLGGGRTRLQPPPFIPTLSLVHKFRYVNGANSGNFNITRGNILNQVLVATTAATTVRIFQAMRLRSVEVWSNPVALGAAPNSLQLEWLGENSPSTAINDSGMGVRPAHVVSSPPPSSSNRWWSISGTSETDVLFNLNIPTDCVIDVVCECRLVESETPTAGDIPAGATVGQVYGDFLDGLASGKLAPIGFIQLP
jgi:hypothetical protein